MRTYRRRELLGLAGGGLIAACAPSRSCAAPDDGAKRFVAEAFRMKSEAVASGDQPFGAVVVRNGAIVGYGPSRVVVEGDVDAHAERVAIRDARSQLGTADLAGAVLYSTSRPCPACEAAAASANLARMFHGPNGADAGRPRRGRDPHDS